nr:MAG: nonstructural protein [Eriocheir sinensis dicistrovirus 1]
MYAQEAREYLAMATAIKSLDLGPKVLEFFDGLHYKLRTLTEKEFSESLKGLEREQEATVMAFDYLSDVVPRWTNKILNMLDYYQPFRAGPSGVVVPPRPSAVSVIVEDEEEEVYVFRDPMLTLVRSGPNPAPPSGVTDEADWLANVDHNEIVLPAPGFKPIHKEPISITGPVSSFPQPEEDSEMLSGFPSLLISGPSRSPKSKTVRVSHLRELYDQIECPILDLDNRLVHKKVAAYRLRQVPNTPKERREELRRLARNARDSIKDPMRGACNIYEAQMFPFRFPMTVQHSVAPETQTMVTGLVTGLREILETGTLVASDAVSAIRETVSTAREGIATAATTVDSALSGLSTMLWAVPLIGSCLYAIWNSTGSARSVLVTVTTVSLGLLLPAGLWEKLKGLWPTEKFEDCLEAQSGFTTESLAHILSLTLGYLTFGGLETSYVKWFLKALPNYGRTVNSWKELSGFIIGVVETFVNAVRSWFGKDSIVLMKTGADRVDDWCQRVMAVLNSYHTGGEIMSPDMIANIQALRREGTDIVNMYRWGPAVSPTLHRYLSMLDEVCRTCSAAMHASKGDRVHPVVLGVTGDPGVGKSFLAKWICSLVLMNIIPKEQAETLGYVFDSQIFQKGSTEYWNGYCKQKAVIMDDWAQSVPVPGMENDFINLIRMANCWPYPLNFADLENKGKNFFDSPFILLTTNATDIRNCKKVIIEPSAITRRIDFGFQITLRPEWNKDGVLDYDKVVQHIDEHGKPPNAWFFKKYLFNLDASQPSTCESFSLDEVISMITGKLVLNTQKHRVNTTAVSKMLEQHYTAQFLTPEEIAANWQAAWLRLVEEAKSDSWSHIIRREAAEHLTWIREQIENNWFIQAFLATTAMILWNLAVTLLVSLAIKWLILPKPGKKIATKKALQKKANIPDECLAQMVDAFHVSDFDVAEDTGTGKYGVVRRFTPAALIRAYERLVGATPVQSNIAPVPRIVHRTVTGTRVTETLHEAQVDMYGSGISDIVYKNVFKMTISRNGVPTDVGQILFLRDNAALMPAHFDDELVKVPDDGTTVTFTSAVSKLSVTYDLAKFKGFRRSLNAEADVVLIVMSSIRSHRDIFSYFIRDSDLASLPKAGVRLDTTDGDGPYVHRSRYMKAERKDMCQVRASGDPYTLVAGWHYFGYTQKGDCGGVLSLEGHTEKQSRRVIGMHVAGEPTLGVGLATVLTQESLQKMMAGLNLVSEVPYTGQMALKPISAPIEGTFIGYTEAERKHHTNPTSCLERTPLHGAWGESLKVPAKLKPFYHDGNLIKPMEKALKPYASPVLSYDTMDVKRAVKHAFTKLRAATVDCERRIFDIYEASAGLPGTSINAIPRNTSPGYPWILDRITNKKPFYGNEGEYTFESKHFMTHKAEVEQILARAKQGVRSDHYFTDFLKDELRKPEKVYAGETRLISSCPLDYTVAWRQYFMAFTDAVQSTRIRNGIAIGINPYTEWNFLGQQLSLKGPHCVAGDFKAFDSSLQPDILWAILDEINEWFGDGPENALVRKVLWMEVVHSRHFGGTSGTADSFYQWNKSLPSGHPATSVINSLYNLTMFNLVWTDIMGVNMASRFWEHVSICVYGDDNVLNIDTRVVDKFNQRTISEAMAKRGMTYTSEIKTEEVADTRSLSEVTFLKRGFRFDKSLRRFVGPQELDSILFVPYWCKNKALMPQIVAANLEFTYLELSLHDPMIWDKFASNVKTKAWSIMQIEPKQLFEREEYLQLSLTQDFIWPL